MLHFRWCWQVVNNTFLWSTATNRPHKMWQRKTLWTLWCKGLTILAVCLFNHIKGSVPAKSMVPVTCAKISPENINNLKCKYKIPCIKTQVGKQLQRDLTILAQLQIKINHLILTTMLIWLLSLRQSFKVNNEIYWLRSLGLGLRLLLNCQGLKKRGLCHRPPTQTAAPQHVCLLLFLYSIPPKVSLFWSGSWIN